MADTFNEQAYTFYRDGLTILTDIKEKTEETILLQRETIFLEQKALVQIKILNNHLEHISGEEITECDIDDI